MKNLAFLCSALLIATGLIGYFAWEAIGATKQSVTALIPAFFGTILLVGALIALKRNYSAVVTRAQACRRDGEDSAAVRRWCR